MFEERQIKRQTLQASLSPHPIKSDKKMIYTGYNNTNKAVNINQLYNYYNNNNKNIRHKQ